MDRPVRLIVIGVTLMLVGLALALLMSLRWIESTFVLNFASFISSTLGLFLGMIGLANYMRLPR